ncbi:hypothetical protein [Sneathiella limimaris]|uniref:hypothetical protein n=1 Tax=Sneathiella limimaris TaxID=1964213 RepID=UPI00146BBB9C|nr:hypothetical protein [Sneathiella limimaris]
MKTTSLLKASAFLFATGFGLAGLGGGAEAASGTSKFVKDVTLTFTGQAAQITIKNEATKKHINFLNPQVQESKLYFDISGNATCKKGSSINGVGAYMFFGTVSINGDKLNSFNTLHKQGSMNIAWHDGDKVVEAQYDTYEVPLSKVKQGHPALRVDAVEELKKKAQAYVQGGGTLVDFYRQDQHLVLQRPLSLAAVCRKYTNQEGSFGYDTKLHTIQITYKGDPEITDKAQLNPQLVSNLGGNGGKQAPEVPFKLTAADFMANIPHHNGKCLPSQNPMLRVNMKATGSELGAVHLVVYSHSNTYSNYGNYYEASGIVYNPEVGDAHVDFSFPLKDMLSQDKYSYMAIHDGKTYHHNMRIKARWKTLPDGEWGAFQEFDTGTFKHTCKPQVAVPLGGQGGKLGYGEQGGSPKLDKAPTEPSEPKLPKKRAPAEPVDPAPKRAKLAPTDPVDPKPSLDKVAPAPQPLQLKRATTD